MLLAATGSATAGASTVAPATYGRSDQVLSNETTFTRWAYVNQIAWIPPRAASTSSPRLERLTWDTPDGFSTTYLLLRARWDASGRGVGGSLRIPGRPNGQTGWVVRGALGPFHLTHLLLVVNRERLRMYFYSRRTPGLECAGQHGQAEHPDPGRTLLGRRALSRSPTKTRATTRTRSGPPTTRR